MGSSSSKGRAERCASTGGRVDDAPFACVRVTEGPTERIEGSAIGGEKEEDDFACGGFEGGTFSSRRVEEGLATEGKVEVEGGPVNKQK